MNPRPFIPLVVLLMTACSRGPTDADAESCARATFPQAGAPLVGRCVDFVDVVSVKILDSQVQEGSARISASAQMRVKKPYNSGSMLASICGRTNSGQGRMLAVGETYSTTINLVFTKWSSGWRCEGTG